MYLAPLNYDRFFKKVFSELRIAKRFLEDFFDVTIEEIEMLPSRHKITDDATGVEFDYRCKMDGHYVIIDMQQWYKTDIVKRFYLYHSLNTALQLENIPLKSIQVINGKQRETKDYNKLDPVITLIWLADDALGVENDYLSYSLTPELLTEFLREKHLWQNEDIAQIQEKRLKVLNLLDNKTRQLDFLARNRLIYALQTNIVQNLKYRRYLAWFKFAEKSKNKNNKKEDFAEYAKDEIFMEIMKRLNKEALEEDDFQYIEDYEKYARQFKQHEISIRDSAYTEGKAEGFDKGKAEGFDKGKAEGKAEGDHQRQIKTAENCLENGINIEMSAQISELSIEEVSTIAKRIGKI
jgi:hypothetical protein